MATMFALPSDIIAREIGFARAVRDKGQWQAFRDHAAPDAQMFDGDKVVAMTVRPWDHQLRQAVLLASPWVVAGAAPAEGFLHRTDTLDSLGDDEPETPCKLHK